MNLVVKNYVKAKGYMQDLFNNEEGVGTVEMVIIIFVLIGLAILFKEQASNLITTYFGKMGSQIENGLFSK